MVTQLEGFHERPPSLGTLLPAPVVKEGKVQVR